MARSIAFVACKPTIMSACQRCKSHKVGCTKKDAAAAKCDRCTLAGVECTPAPPSRQGKRRRPEEVGPAFEQSGTVLLNLSSSDVSNLVSRMIREAGRKDSCAYFLLGFFQDKVELPPQASLLFLLRYWAEMATAKNSHSALKDTLSLAVALGISVADVVGLPMRSGLKPSDLPPPLGLVTLLDALPGFTFARSAHPRPDGSVSLYANQAFRDGICSLETLRAAWAPNTLPMLSKFVHHDDLCVHVTLP